MYDLEEQITEILGPGRGHSVNRMFPCFLHEDRHPSLSVNLDEGLWYCFSCGEKGNYESLCRRLGEPVDGNYRVIKALRDASRYPEERNDFTALAGRFVDSRRRERHHYFELFLRQRFIRPEAADIFSLGWDEGGERIAFPYPDIEGRVRGIKYRHRSGNKTAECGSEFELYHPELAVGRKNVWICEGESDTIKLWSEVNDELQGFCGTSGASVSEAQWVRFATSFLFSERIYLCYDADEEGDRCAATAMRVLGDKCVRVRPTKGKDITEHLLAGGRVGELI